MCTCTPRAKTLYSIDHQTILRVCMSYDGREAIEMQERRVNLCVFVFGKKRVGEQEKKLNFFCLSLDFNNFSNTHFSYLSNSNIAVGLNRKTNRLRSLSYMYMSIPLACVCVCLVRCTIGFQYTYSFDRWPCALFTILDRTDIIIILDMPHVRIR